MGSGPITTGEDPVQKKQGKVTVKYDRKELRKRLVLEEWIIEQLSELYDCEVSGDLHLDAPLKEGKSLNDTRGICFTRGLSHCINLGTNLRITQPHPQLLGRLFVLQH